jgi:methionine synthase I (cobalamin-dependent)
LDGLIKAMCAEGPVLTDGAWGTQLQARGLAIGECADAWNLSHPDRVAAVANAYVVAGSRVILTNTFGGSRIALARHGLGDDTVRINRAGAEISRSAAGNRAAVFGSIGPTGKALFMGELSEEEALAAFEEQASALAGSVDGLVVETMTDLNEAKVAVQAATATGLPVVACMVFGLGHHGDRTITGVTIEQAVEELTAAGADAIGSNCGTGAHKMLHICRRLKSLTDLPIWIKPNAGLPVLEGGRAVYETTPDEFAIEAYALVEAGANFIGGCCGTTPAHIRATASLLC